MGKASKWFRSLLGLKKTTTDALPPPHTHKRRWSFVKSSIRDNKGQLQHASTVSSSAARDIREDKLDHHPSSSSSAVAAASSDDPSERARAAAAASAEAAVEAAFVAAHVAVEVMRLTSSSGRCAAAYGGQAGAAVLKIQSVFRGYLARRALRALKGLVKIQALVRGHIERKRNAEDMRKMQAVLRAQARARAERAQLSESSQSSSKSSHFQRHPGPATPEKSEYAVRSKSSRQDQSPLLWRNASKASGRIAGCYERTQLGRNWSERRVNERIWDEREVNNGYVGDEKSDKILEIDPGKPTFTPKHRNLVQAFRHSLPLDQVSHSFTTSKESTARKTTPSPFSCEVQSLSPLEFSHDAEEGAFCTADNSPQFYSASSRGGSTKRSPFTPTKSDGSRNYLSGYADHPNYMSYTESSRAKLRSLSAPKQRPNLEKSSSTKRYSVHGLGDSRSVSQKVSSLHSDFASKAYPGSGRLDRLGMPIRGDGFGYRY